MLLTRFVRIQLTIFAIASIIGLAVMAYQYLQVATLLGLGRLSVTLELPASGGLYRFSNVTYRGVQIGKVTGIKVVNGQHVDATLSLNTSPPVPADLVAQVRSVSAVGEQYVDLQPHHDSPPYLHDGSVISMSHTSIPQAVGPMLDQLSALVTSIPKDRLHALLDETFSGFNGAGYDFGSLLDSTATLSRDFNGIGAQTRTLIEDSAPLLHSQVDSTKSLRTWARSLAGITEQLDHNDPQLRTLLATGPGFAQETERLLNQIKPTLPVLLANLTTIGQVAVTYHASLEQLLVLVPPTVAVYQAAAPGNSPTGLTTGDFTIALGDPPACTVGFLPPSLWRSPADTTTIDTPDGLYCKLPQDSPIAVRGARNYPCMGHPGKRAPTVQICDSDKPYMPLALRQHALGATQLDPNLLSQGVPLDDRVNDTNREFGPLEGTPLPAGVTPQPHMAPPLAPAPPPPPPDTHTGAALPPGPGPTGPGVAPSSFDHNGSRPGPALAVVPYDPHTGAYMTPDSQMYRARDLTASASQKSWKDLVLEP
jgi:phospholipid/cholesterol/gamma-HCH transport system substrate-binding protein